MEEKPKLNLLDELFLKVCKKLKNHDKELNEKFIKLSNNFSRFKFIWHIKFVHNELENLFKSESYEKKDKTKANEFRKEGNDLFKIKRYYDALIKYNSSIKYAPVLIRNASDNEENDLALSYANRSAVFYHLNEFLLCLNDIESSIKSGYPQKLKSKLIERKLNCLIKLENYALASEFLKQEKKYLDAAILRNFESKINNLHTNKTHLDIDHQKEYYFKNYGQISFNLEHVNDKMPNASSSILIDYSLEKGMYIKANEDIEPGELIVNEEPYASVLLAENVENNCYECMLKLNVLKMNLTFCQQCSRVVYCSEKCANLSWNSAHKNECKYFKLLAYESGLTHMEWLALRIVLKAGKTYLIKLRPLLEEYEFKYEAINRDMSSLLLIDEDASKAYKSNSYLPIFNLITNSRIRKLNDLFRRSFVSLFLVKLLEKSDFFQGDSSELFKENSWFIGGLILRHLQSISCNAHEVSELKLSDNKKNAMTQSSAQGIGAGIYSILSIFNHSCDPHVNRNFRGSKCQVRSIQTIRKGEEIFDNYGVVYAVNEIKERQEKLREQYFFECKCIPCRNNWPSYENIPNDLALIKIKCTECIKNNSNVSDCPKCLNELDNLNLGQLNAQQALRSLLGFNSDFDLNEKIVISTIEKIFEYFCNYLKLLAYHNAERPFQDYNNYEEALKQCLNLINLKN